MDLQHILICPLVYDYLQRGVKSLSPSVYVKAVRCFIQLKKVWGKKEIEGHIWTERLSGLVAVGQQH